jgi:glycine/D-amino acid oxidase-like deaminating enzyme
MTAFVTPAKLGAPRAIAAATEETKSRAEGEDPLRFMEPFSEFSDLEGSACPSRSPTGATLTRLRRSVNPRPPKRLRRSAVIVGCGIFGASAALELARRGFAVAVLDRRPAPALGSTRRSSCVIRCHYGARDAIRIAHEGRAIWSDWAQHLGLRRPRARYVACGVLFLLREGTPRLAAPTLGLKPEASADDLARIVSGMQEMGVGCELQRGGALRRAFPFFDFASRGEVGLVEPDSGYVAGPREATLDLVEAGEKAGARFRFDETVLAIETTGGDRPRVAAVRTTRGRLRADVVVNAAGPGSHEVNVLARCPLPLVTAPLGQTVVEVSLAGEPPPRLPAMIDLVHGFYLRPSARGVRLGAALPRDHRDFRARAVERTDAGVLGEFAREKLAALRHRWPGVRVRSVRPLAALYDWTAADGYPVIDRTDVEGYLVAVGTSGAWFKGAPVVGEILAELAANPDARRVRLPRTGHVVDLATFSRRRAPLS